MWLPHFQIFKEDLFKKNPQSPYCQTEVLPEGLDFEIAVILCVQFLGALVYIKLYIC